MTPLASHRNHGEKFWNIETRKTVVGAHVSSKGRLAVAIREVHDETKTDHILSFKFDAADLFMLAQYKLKNYIQDVSK